MAKMNWVKKLVSGKEWDNYYSKIPGYCFLFQDKNNIWVGFGIIEKCFDCMDLTDDELRQIQEYREANNIYPQPLKNEKFD